MVGHSWEVHGVQLTINCWLYLGRSSCLCLCLWLQVVTRHEDLLQQATGIETLEGSCTTVILIIHLLIITIFSQVKYLES